MTPVVSRYDTASSWRGDHPSSVWLDRAAELERSIRTFLHLATALELSGNEERTLLDLNACDMALLRLAPANAFQIGRAKLERRVAYAIRILRRMLVARSR